ncbi:flavin reductase family protein [Streptomyces roseifaciens]
MLTDERLLRTCLGHFATGVTVVTCDVDGAPHGATVNAFTAVSLDPALVLVSLHRRSKAGRHLAGGPEGRPFTVNVLGEDQKDLAEHFAGRRSAAPPRWAPRWAPRPPTGLAPRLAGTLATLACTPWAAYDGGDHVLVVGRVEEAEYREGGRPLVFYEGELRGL